jgi:hypothetical protein
MLRSSGFNAAAARPDPARLFVGVFFRLPHY